VAQTLLSDTYGSAEVSAWLAGERASLSAPETARAAAPAPGQDGVRDLMRAFGMPLAGGPRAA
jgi:hypothetical protein